MKNPRLKLLGLALLLGGLILCGFGLSLLLGPPQYQATVRIEIKPESDIAAANGLASESPDFDPYFIQTTFEIIKSEMVLSNVVARLNLNEVWSKKFNGGKKLTLHKTIRRIQKGLKIKLVRNTRFIDVSFTDDDPNEAAKIANAIPYAYCDYQIKVRRQLEIKGLKALRQQYQDEEKQISVMQSNVDSLREQFKIQDDNSTNQSPEPQSYRDTKRKLEQMLQNHKLLGLKINSIETPDAIPKDQMVQVIDFAKPPKVPVGPNRFLGAILLALGLVSILGGLFLLKPPSKFAAKFLRI